MTLQPGRDYPSRIGETLGEFFEALPIVFTRSEAINVSNDIGIAPITCDAYLRRLLEAGRIAREKYGIYKKTGTV
jgi:hypothetical protein